VVTGQLTNEEIAARSSIGFFLFTPVGCNERLLEECGFLVREVRDVTEAVASVSGKWRDAREERRAALAELEGEAAFRELQRFLDAVHTLAGERRLSRYMYLATVSAGAKLTPPMAAVPRQHPRDAQPWRPPVTQFFRRTAASLPFRSAAIAAFPAAACAQDGSRARLPPELVACAPVRVPGIPSSRATAISTVARRVSKA
jgi:hypothetical protein